MAARRPVCPRRLASPKSSSRAPPASCDWRPLPPTKARGRCRPSTRSPTSARCSDRSAPWRSSGRTTSRCFQQRCRRRFAAAVAAGNPVIAKATVASGHHAPVRGGGPGGGGSEGACRRGLCSSSIAPAMRTAQRWCPITDRRTGYTGSRSAGLVLKLKAAADKAGKPIYLELSSINPVYSAGRTGRGLEGSRRRVRHQQPDGERAVLHEPRPRAPVCGRSSEVHRSRSAAIRERPGPPARCCRASREESAGAVSDACVRPARMVTRTGAGDAGSTAVSNTLLRGRRKRSLSTRTSCRPKRSEMPALSRRGGRFDRLAAIIDASKAI